MCNSTTGTTPAPHECCGQQRGCTHPSELRLPTSRDPTRHAYGLSTQGREETPGTTPPTPSGVSWAPAGLWESRLRDEVHVKEAYRQAAASDPGPSSRLAHEKEGAQHKPGPTGWPCVCPALPRAGGRPLGAGGPALSPETPKQHTDQQSSPTGLSTKQRPLREELSAGPELRPEQSAQEPAEVTGAFPAAST